MTNTPTKRSRSFGLVRLELADNGWLDEAAVRIAPEDTDRAGLPVRSGDDEIEHVRHKRRFGQRSVEIVIGEVLESHLPILPGRGPTTR